MDNTDKLLITLLKENGRLSYKQLSQKVHLSQPAVKERIEKLLDTNTISKFTIETGRLKNQISAFIHIKTSQCNELEVILNSLENVETYIVWQVIIITVQKFNVRATTIC